MDFNLEQGDTLKKEVILENELKTVAMKVDTVVTITFNSSQYQVVFGTNDIIEDADNNIISFLNDRTFNSCIEDTLSAYFNRIGRPFYSILFGYPGGFIPYGDHTETRQELNRYRYQEYEYSTVCGTVGVIKKAELDFFIYYNNNTRQIKTNKHIPSKQIEIVDSIGRKYILNQNRYDNETSTFDSSGLLPGIYTVKIQNINKKIYVY
jgi:hypothetical protein